MPDWGKVISKPVERPLEDWSFEGMMSSRRLGSIPGYSVV